MRRRGASNRPSACAESITEFGVRFCIIRNQKKSPRPPILGEPERTVPEAVVGYFGNG